MGWGKLYIFLERRVVLKSSKKKKRVRELYRNGYNAAEIADIITKENAAEGINKKTTREAIKKCIQRNFKDLKREHKENAKARKEVERALDYESKKFISDKSLILKNRSAYETKNNGDIVLKKETDYVFASDMPRRLVNADKALKLEELKGDENIRVSVNSFYANNNKNNTTRLLKNYETDILLNKKINY